ncbi:NAD-dependent succinate-semialdehyde dehydrogenase (plasmid) [Rhizobium sp. TRM96647]|uniref:NAD-dependent succinate-semialdehyde dehydrogenase n=1 Tax=unclassified Rhizobium TaxID=2613769 RepID=UPI0021E9495B|nr:MULTISPECIES: NAD-dependent succinate-semialdehyde dehydrogenase [unclassified Rhizobium]MCV3735241.1 NAD-dependent succinate-semialdehyde dehydrogenase [Rhizobium sp. TRM96647]MCV3757996.1 NAD-dependent succinate-semialdehyde dehydrogenase [Rhizobium sp. TRM96650]
MNAIFARPACHDALERLKDRHLLKSLAYVGGRWVANSANRTFEVRDPASSVPLAWVSALDAGETGDAIDAASAALAEWRAMLPQDRAAILRRWYDLMLSTRDDLALIMTLEQGKPLSESQGEIAYAASFVEWYAEEGKRLNAESVTSHLPGAEMIVRREALGVVGIVTPWNFPSAMVTRKAAAALAAGCTVVAHPSSETPLSALALAELGERAGLPAGVFNVVTGDAATIVGRMCKDPRIRAVSFTGSTEVGKIIAGQCASTMKRLVMELGGHAPLIVFDDADIDRAVDIAVNAKFATSGQDCLAANRIYVQRPVLGAFNAAFKARIEALTVGAGLEPGVEIGPLMHARAVAKVDEQVQDAIGRGARCLTGGAVHAAGPLFYAPTLLTEVPDDALIMREETFGPVAAVTAFDTEAEVIARANDSEYGLVAYVVTENGARQMRLGRVLEYGMVAINRVKITGGPIPFGGWKQSGIGREGSRHGLEAFTELKYLCIDTAA